MIELLEFLKRVSFLPKPFLICIDFDGGKGHSLYVHDVLWDGFSDSVVVKYTYARLGLRGDTNQKEWIVDPLGGHPYLRVRQVCRTVKEHHRRVTLSIHRVKS